MRFPYVALSAVLLAACGSVELEQPSPTIREIPLYESAYIGNIECVAQGAYPHIQGLPSVQVEININSVLDEYAHDIATNIAACPAQLQDLVEDNAKLTDNTAVDYKVTLLNDKYLSVVLIASQYFEGAAHPNNSMEALVFDLKTGQPQTLADIFGGVPDYMTVLTAAVQAEAIKNDIEYPSETSNPIRQFYLTEDAIVLTDLYSVHALQGFEVEIPNAK